MGDTWLPRAELKGQIITTRNNLIVLRIFEKGARKTDLSSITRWKVWVGSDVLDSASAPTAFDWTTYSETAGDLLALNLGAYDLDPGIQPLRILWYDAVNTLGVEAENIVEVAVKTPASGTSVPTAAAGVVDSLTFTVASTGAQVTMTVAVGDIPGTYQVILTPV